ncbi:hypothetical protein CDAR_451251 [Caerostris darwini]|uniref:Uncharacterized protein n=1 Tax=Caerostris darwini TaxID=1538125 RepID=A0AAV4SYU7_9ARAC|nr:hypothetical protein CDAR_451251 [Caerostris darwini]
MEPALCCVRHSSHDVTGSRLMEAPRVCWWSKRKGGFQFLTIILFCSFAPFFSHSFFLPVTTASENITSSCYSWGASCRGWLKL